MKHNVTTDWDGDVMRVECSCGMLREYTRRPDGTLERTRFIPSPTDSDFQHAAGAGGVEMGPACIDSAAPGEEFFINGDTPDDPRLGPWLDALKGLDW